MRTVKIYFARFRPGGGATYERSLCIGLRRTAPHLSTAFSLVFVRVKSLLLLLRGQKKRRDEQSYCLMLRRSTTSWPHRPLFPPFFVLFICVLNLSYYFPAETGHAVSTLTSCRREYRTIYIRCFQYPELQNLLMCASAAFNEEV